MKKTTLPAGVKSPAAALRAASRPASTDAEPKTARAAADRALAVVSSDPVADLLAARAAEVRAVRSRSAAQVRRPSPVAMVSKYLRDAADGARVAGVPEVENTMNSGLVALDIHAVVPANVAAAFLGGELTGRRRVYPCEIAAEALAVWIGDYLQRFLEHPLGGLDDERRAALRLPTRIGAIRSAAESFLPRLTVAPSVPTGADFEEARKTLLKVAEETEVLP